jgi:hypothetical protein
MALYQRCVHLGCRVPWCPTPSGGSAPATAPSRTRPASTRRAGPARAGPLRHRGAGRPDRGRHLHGHHRPPGGPTPPARSRRGRTAPAAPSSSTDGGQGQDEGVMTPCRSSRIGTRMRPGRSRRWAPATASRTATAGWSMACWVGRNARPSCPSVDRGSAGSWVVAGPCGPDGSLTPSARRSGWSRGSRWTQADHVLGSPAHRGQVGLLWRSWGAWATPSSCMAVPASAKRRSAVVAEAARAHWREAATT